MDYSYGLLGEKLGHSISPQIHELILKHLNISGTYKMLEVEPQKLGGIVNSIKSQGFNGVNVTIPYKVEVMKYIDSVSKKALDIGSVNTIHFKDGKSFGYNTDYYGFEMLLKKYGICIKDKDVVVLGTGGAAKSVIRCIKDNEPKSLHTVSRNPKKGNYPDWWNVISYDDLKSIDSGDVIINCTPCGMYPKVDFSAVGEEIIAKFKEAADVIYNPKETLFLKYAKNSGLKAVNGLYMLVGQAVVSEEIWNDVKIKSEVVDKIFSKVSEIIK